MSRGFDAEVTGALWLTKTTEQPAVLVPHPRQVAVFDQMLSGPAYVKPPRRRPTWGTVASFSFLMLAVGYLAGLAASVIL